MTAVQIHFDHPQYAAVENTIRHALRDLYGFVPLNLGCELASHVHTAVSEYQTALLADVARKLEVSCSPTK